MKYLLACICTWIVATSMDNPSSNPIAREIAYEWNKAVIAISYDWNKNVEQSGNELQQIGRDIQFAYVHEIQPAMKSFAALYLKPRALGGTPYEVSASYTVGELFGTADIREF